MVALIKWRWAGEGNLIPLTYYHASHLPATQPRAEDDTLKLPHVGSSAGRPSKFGSRVLGCGQQVSSLGTTPKGRSQVSWQHPGSVKTNSQS